MRRIVVVGADARVVGEPRCWFRRVRYGRRSVRRRRSRRCASRCAPDRRTSPGTCRVRSARRHRPDVDANEHSDGSRPRIQRRGARRCERRSPSFNADRSIARRRRRDHVGGERIGGTRRQRGGVAVRRGGRLRPRSRRCPFVVGSVIGGTSFVAWVPDVTTSTDASRVRSVTWSAARLPCTTSAGQSSSRSPSPTTTRRCSSTRRRIGSTSPRRLPHVAGASEAMEAAVAAGAWCAWLSGSGPTVGMLAPIDRADEVAALCRPAVTRRCCRSIRSAPGCTDDRRHVSTSGVRRQRSSGSMRSVDTIGKRQVPVHETVRRWACRSKNLARQSASSACSRGTGRPTTTAAERPDRQRRRERRRRPGVDEMSVGDDPASCRVCDLGVTNVRVRRTVRFDGSLPATPRAGRGSRRPPRSVAGRRGVRIRSRSRSTTSTRGRRRTPDACHRRRRRTRQRSAVPGAGAVGDTELGRAAHRCDRRCGAGSCPDALRTATQGDDGLDRLDARAAPSSATAAVRGGGPMRPGSSRCDSRGHAASVSRRT